MHHATAALFMTGYTGNLLGGKTGGERRRYVELGKAGLSPHSCLASSLLIVPLLVYWLTRPEIKHTPDAPDLARKELAQWQYDTRRVAHAGDRRVAGAMDFWQLARRDATTAFYRSSIFITGAACSPVPRHKPRAPDTLIWFCRAADDG